MQIFVIEQCFVLLRTPYPSLPFLSVQGMSPTPLWHEESSDYIYLCVFCELFNLNSTYETHVVISGLKTNSNFRRKTNLAGTSTVRVCNSASPRRAG